MPLTPLPDWLPALPEIVLVCAAMALLIIGVLRGEESSRLVSWLAVAVLIVTLCLAGAVGIERRSGFYGMFITDSFAVFLKSLIPIGSAVTAILPLRFQGRAPTAPVSFAGIIVFGANRVDG